MSRRRILAPACSMLVVAILSTFGIVDPTTVAAEDILDLPRRYELGPLTLDDFRADPPESPYWAYSNAEVRFAADYKMESDGRIYEASLKDVDVYARFNKDKSWIIKARAADILDHEQGHFDISHILAMQAEIALLKQIQAGRPLKGVARTEALAIEALQTHLANTLSEFMEKSKLADLHADYDRVTRHGRSAGPQAQARKQHRDLLKELSAELAELRGED